MNLSTRHWKVGLYVAAVLAAAWLWFWILKFGLRIGEWAAVTVLMWIPGVLSILFRFVFKEGFGDLGWRVGKARFWFWAYVGPLALASFSIILALLFGRVTLSPHLQDQTMLDAVFFKLSWPMRDSSTAGFLWQRFLSVALIGIVPGFFCAFGEELGWRGYLLPRMMQAGWPYPLLLSGLFWGSR